ncbi:unnamed protein product [Closterium sp. Naga37s-1]|nr:unnamed protein product [Closterium sp. Naga37s-1]
MALTVDDAIATLFTLTQHDEQPGVQGLTSTMVYDASYRTSYTEYAEVAAFQLSLEDDTAAINQLDALLADGKDALASLYTYRSVSKSFPESVQALDENAEPGLLQEAFALVDVEIQRLRDIHLWQMRAQSLIAADLQRFSGEMTGPTLTHLWSLLRVLDTCLLLDLLKHTKAAPLPDLLWFRRAVQSGRVDAAKGSDTDSDLEEFWSKRWAVLSSLQVGIPGNETVEEFFVQLMVVATGTIESGRTLLFADRLMLLRVLPVLISLAARTEAEADTLFRRRVKLDRLLRLFKREPLVAGYKEVPFALASLLPDLSPFFRKLCVEKGVLLPIPSNMDAKEVSRVYDLLPQMPVIVKAHEEFCPPSLQPPNAASWRNPLSSFLQPTPPLFAFSVTSLTVMKYARVKSRSSQAKEVRVEVYQVLLEGLLLLSPPHPCPSAGTAGAGAAGVGGVGPGGGKGKQSLSAYEQMVQHGFSQAELQAVLQLIISKASLPPSLLSPFQLITYMKGVAAMTTAVEENIAWGVAAMMTAVEGGIAWVLREGHASHLLYPPAPSPNAADRIHQGRGGDDDSGGGRHCMAYIKGVAAMMTAVEGDIAWVLREAIHADVQEFARVYVASLLKRVSSSNMDSPYAR